jgi:DsbC/DsbD-like thiol-disulfide interchange protein
LRAGVEIKLERGWKTYWRYPGDSGVPPHFDFSQSSNVKSVTVLWPAPHRFSDEGGESIGYKEAVTFPLRIEPQDPGKPVTLHVSLDYAVCEKLCAPAKGAATLPLTRNATPFDAALDASEARVPRGTTVNDRGPLAVSAVRRDATGKPAMVTVDLIAPDQIAVDLFAEGPTPEWALPLPSPVKGTPPGQRRFTFALDGLPTGVTPDGKTLTLTAVAGSDAIEVKARLD